MINPFTYWYEKSNKHCLVSFILSEHTPGKDKTLIQDSITFFSLGDSMRTFEKKPRKEEVSFPDKQF